MHYGCAYLRALQHPDGESAVSSDSADSAQERLLRGDRVEPEARDVEGDERGEDPVP